MSGLVAYNTTPITILTGADNPNSKEWVFDNLGNVTLPLGGDIVNSEGDSVLTGDSNVRKTIATVTIGTPTVVWTGAEPAVSSAKLLVQVECEVLDDLTGYHTQTCEIIIASRRNQYAPVISVYGVVYTSTEQLVTFTAQRNNTTTNIEIVGTSSLIAGNNPLVRIYSIEQISRI